MMRWKITAIIATLICSATFINSSYGQFSKYKARAEGEPAVETPSAEVAPPTEMSEPPLEIDDSSFGSDEGMEEDSETIMPSRNRDSVDSARKIITGANGGGADYFGRRDSTPGPTGEKASKYVNLNPETAFGPEIVESFNFPNVSLLDLTKRMQELTGINLILDKDVKGNISILAPSPITVGDAWKAYLSALNTNGLSIVKSGAFYKIVQNRNIRYIPTKIYTGSYTPDTENYIMKIIPLKNVSSAEITRSFRPFMTRYGRIIEIKQTNTIIIQDSGDNINRLTRLIKFIDVPGHEESLQIIKVENTSAQEIAKLLEKILRDNSSNKTAFRREQGTVDIRSIKITAEPRTNSLIAMANNEAAKQLRDLVKKLDVKVMSSNGGQIHVYYLHHGDAETLAKTLSGLVSESNSKGAVRFTKETSDDQNLFSSSVKITSDKSNNALVITASPTDYMTLKKVIDKLDVARDQVYIEGMIMETQISRNNNFGLSIVGVYGSGAGKAGFTGGSTDLLNYLSNNITSLGGLFAGAGTGKAVTLATPTGDVKISSVNALITAIATNSNTNVLATPQILAMDNEEGNFEVGETVPQPEKTNAANGSTSVSVKQQKVALTLKITPQINKVTRFVKMKIDQKIDDFSNRRLPEGLQSEGVATTTRSVVTSVSVRDRDTIAMGGLMRDKEVDTESKVPLLGDIPVLGWLFKQKSKQLDKVNLLFFLTPKILDSYEDTVADKVKDVLNRRNAHLEDEVGGNDPFGSTVKGLYKKADKQAKGPLYDKELTEKYNKNNNDPDGIGSNTEENEPQTSTENLDQN